MITFLHLCAFIGISMCAHRLGELWKKYHPHIKIEAHHAPIVGALGTAATDPSIWHGVYEFIVHIVVYSGHVIPLH